MVTTFSKLNNENSVLKNIGSIKTLIRMGKSYTKEEVIKELKNTDDFKNGIISEEHIDGIVDSLTKQNLLS